MRRRPGISGLQRGVQTKVRKCQGRAHLSHTEMVFLASSERLAQDVYRTLGDSVNQTKLETMRAQMAAFKDKLEEFAIRHRCLAATERKYIRQLT